MLLAWFKLNESDIEARQYLYTEIPYHYTWQSSFWQRRQQNRKTVSRLYSVTVAQQELYFLRLLLLHVRGATSYEYLRTVDDKICSTFRESCAKRGLLENDNEIIETLEEAISFHMPKQLRFLFATICVFHSPSNALDMFNTFKEHLIEDFSRTYDEETSCNLALKDIKETLAIQNIRPVDVGLPDPGEVNLETIIDVHEELLAANSYYSSLNETQKSIVDSVLAAVEAQDIFDNLLFVDGPGGTGKTHVYKTIIHKLRSVQKTVVSVAWTGIAATLLPEGRTVHSRFKFPVPLLENSTSSMKPNSYEAEALRCASVIIWDESPMAPKYALDMLDKLLKDVTGSYFPFGEKIILLGGDFRQVLPVIPRASEAAIIESSIRNSVHWPLFKVFKLTQNMRAQNDLAFSEWLLKLGNDELPKLNHISSQTIEIPAEFLSTDIVSDIYDNNFNSTTSLRYANSAILCPLNEDCFSINDKVLDRLDGETFEYFSIDDVDCEEDCEREYFPPEFLHSLTPTGMPRHILRLKEGAIVMLLRNLNPKRGLCNGTRLVVNKCTPNVIIASILSGEQRDSIVFIPRITLAPSDSSLPFILKRKQFPIRLAFAMTINKSQGQTFSKIGIFLKHPVFSHGQLYVAFSRVQSFNDVKVQIVPVEKQGVDRNGNGFTSNVVHSDALNN